MYTPWSLENGGTYVIPGTATDGQGNNVITEGIDAEEFLASHKYLSLANISLHPASFPIHKLIWLSRYGIVALCGPPGTCFVSDGRLLHAGAPRTTISDVGEIFSLVADEMAEAEAELHSQLSSTVLATRTCTSTNTANTIDSRN